MQVTYLNHSGFMLETDTAYFLFDYYKGTIPELIKEKPLVVFVSHSHGDHYNREIFRLLKYRSNIQYVLAKDIPTKKLIVEWQERGIELEPHLLSIRKNVSQKLLLPNGKVLMITTLKSTDAGVAYVLEYEGQTFYHAGDLNLWYWEGETKQYNQNMTTAYLREMEKLRDKQIDVAFVPLDPRLEQHAYDGFKIFMEYTKNRYIFPMHMWGEYSIIPKLLEEYPQYKEQVVVITQDEQSFQIGSC